MRLPVVKHVRFWHKLFYLWGKITGNYYRDNKLLLYVQAKRKLDYRHGKVNGKDGG